jgi:cell division protein FtsB
MPRRSPTAPTRAPESEPDDLPLDPGEVAEDEAPKLIRDLSELPVLGLTRRRTGYLLGALLACWVLLVFARQISEAAAASDRADELAAANQQLAAHVAGLEAEYDLIRDPEFIALEARKYGFGEGREIPFQLANDAPPLASDAPGSAAVKLGAVPTTRTPLEGWLEVLFGPAG